MSIEGKIKDSHLLTEVFGHWPSFHGAEVLKIVLDCNKDGSDYGPHLQVAIDMVDFERHVDAIRHYRIESHILVNLRFLEVDGLTINGFNNQNVLHGLHIQDISDRQMERIKFQVTFDYDLPGDVKFQCYAIIIDSVERLTPEDI